MREMGLGPSDILNMVQNFLKKVKRKIHLMIACQDVRGTMDLWHSENKKKI